MNIHVAAREKNPQVNTFGTHVNTHDAQMIMQITRTTEHNWVVNNTVVSTVRI